MSDTSDESADFTQPITGASSPGPVPKASDPAASTHSVHRSPSTTAAVVPATPSVPTPYDAPRPAPPAASSVPAGWYPLAGEQRYWDGQAWTEHRAPAAPTMHAGFVQVQPAYAMHTQLITDARTNTAEIVIAWIFTVITLGYMLPWAIAASRGKSNSWAVGLVNFFLGWTLIGWVAALVMACTAHQVAGVRHY